MLIRVGWLIVAISHSLSSEVRAVQYQSGAVASSFRHSYASGMVYNSKEDKLFITGITYQPSHTQTPQAKPSCFVAKLGLANENDPASFGIVNEASIDTNPAHGETCNDITTMPCKDNANLTVIGNVRKDDNKEFGFVTSLQEIDGSSSSSSGSTGVFGIPPMEIMGHSEPITYPVNVKTTSDEIHGETKSFVYVLSLVSSNSEPSTSYERIMSATPYPNWIPSTAKNGNFKYGFPYHIAISKFLCAKQQEETETFQSMQLELLTNETYSSHELLSMAGIHSNINLPSDLSLNVGGMAISAVSDTLTVVGSIQSQDRTSSTGFVVKLLSSTLKTPQSSSSSIVFQGSDIVSSSGSTQNIHYHYANSCIHASSVSSSEEYLYVVGSSQQQSTLPIQPVLIKYKLDMMEKVWEQTLQVQHQDFGSWATTPTGSGVTCTVSVDGSSIYLAGNIAGGTILKDLGVGSAHGKMDYFVSSLKSEDGSVEWLRQWGSAEDDNVVDMVLNDDDGTIVVYGTTSGSMFRTKGMDDGESKTDIFVSTLDALDGSEKVIVSSESSSNVGVASGSDEGSGGGVEGGSVAAAGIGPASVLAKSSAAVNISFFIAGLILIICATFGTCVISARREQERKEQQKMLSIFRYLHAFDADDINIRRSPAGGYHCTYMDEEIVMGRRKSLFKFEDPSSNTLLSEDDDSGSEEGTSSSTSSSSRKTGRPPLNGAALHSSVVDDYMFMSNRKINARPSLEENSVNDEEREALHSNH